MPGNLTRWNANHGRGDRSKARRGETWRSGPMYGYCYIPGDKRAGIPGRLEIDEETAPIVRRIFEALANGMSASKLAAQFNAEGVPTVLGGTWRHATIIYLIKNPTYTGETTWGATETVKGKRRRATDATPIQRIPVPTLVSLNASRGPVAKLYTRRERATESPRCVLWPLLYQRVKRLRRGQNSLLLAMLQCVESLATGPREAFRVSTGGPRCRRTPARRPRATPSMTIYCAV